MNMATINSTTFITHITMKQMCLMMKEIDIALEDFVRNKTIKNKLYNTTDTNNTYVDVPFDVPTNYLKSFPAFCTKFAARSCVLTPLKECGECSNTKAAIFGFVIILLGLFIIMGNCLVICLFLKKKSVFTGNYVKIKVSLAVADLFTGVMCLVVIFPNFVLTMHSTSHEVVKLSLCLAGTTRAIAGGILHVLTLTASLFHLVFLGQQRFYAIQWPVRYKRQSRWSVYIGLFIVWTSALLCSVIPLWFPDKLNFGYQILAFFFIPAVTTFTSAVHEHYTELLIMFSLSTVLPFLLMTGTSIGTGISLVRRIKKTSHLLPASNARKKEVTAFVVMAAMQIGFTVTFIPFITYVTLNFNSYFTKIDSSVYAMVSFTLSLSNSLVNVLVYSVLDVKFRQTITSSFSACLSRICHRCRLV